MLWRPEKYQPKASHSGCSYQVIRTRWLHRDHLRYKKGRPKGEFISTTTHTPKTSQPLEIKNSHYSRTYQRTTVKNTDWTKQHVRKSHQPNPKKKKTKWPDDIISYGNWNALKGLSPNIRWWSEAAKLYTVAKFLTLIRHSSSFTLLT